MKNEKKLTILLTSPCLLSRVYFFFQKTADATHNSKITKPFTILTKQLVVSVRFRAITSDIKNQRLVP